MKPINANPNAQFKAPNAGAAAPKPAAANEPKDAVTLSNANKKSEFPPKWYYKASGAFADALDKMAATPVLGPGLAVAAGVALAATALVAAPFIVIGDYLGVPVDKL